MLDLPDRGAPLRMTTCPGSTVAGMMPPGTEEGRDVTSLYRTVLLTGRRRRWGSYRAQETLTHEATDGVPASSTRNSMYHPGGASVPDAGPFTVSTPLPAENVSGT